MPYSLIAFLLIPAGIYLSLDDKNMDANQFPANIDHLIYAAPDLKTGMDEIEALLGVRPVIGGRHPSYGTHNALLSIGDSIYLEVIAPDPDLEPPANGTWLAEKFRRPSGLVTWVLRVENIEHARSNAIDYGVALGEVQAGQREKPDGTLLSWTLTDPYAMPLDGAIPFLINWGNTAHPASSLPGGGRLASLKIMHPSPDAVRQNLTIIGVNVEVIQSPTFKLVAEINTKNGTVQIK